MSEKATVLVSEAKEVSSGEGQYGPWTLWQVIDGNEDRYSTFKKELYDAAKGLEGKRAELEYTQNDKGKKLEAIKEAPAAKDGDQPELGTGKYITGQKPPIEARRIFASTSQNNSARSLGPAVAAAELQFKLQAVTREVTPDLLESTVERWFKFFERLRQQSAEVNFLDLLRKGRAMEDADIPFMPEYEGPN